MPDTTTAEYRIKLNLAERALIADIAAALPDQRGGAFIGADLALRLALDVTHRVILAGDLAKYQPALPAAAKPRS